MPESMEQEVRHCFKESSHMAHNWPEPRVGPFWCKGQGTDESHKVLPEPDYVTAPEDVAPNDDEWSIVAPPDSEAPLEWGPFGLNARGESVHDRKPLPVENKQTDTVWTIADNTRQILDEIQSAQLPILDARAAYGDKVQNQIEQAAMINAYLSGREVRGVDVPFIFILIKCHRAGKMPDYADSYDDIEGYLQIARDVIGDDMIQATTTKEYMEKKNAGNQSEGRLIQNFSRHRNEQAVDSNVPDEWSDDL